METPKPSADEVTWVYTERGSYRHALVPGIGVRGWPVCSVPHGPYHFLNVKTWYGTGNQKEYEKALTKKKCPKCIEAVPALADMP